MPSGEHPRPDRGSPLLLAFSGDSFRGIRAVGARPCPRAVHLFGWFAISAGVDEQASAVPADWLSTNQHNGWRIPRHGEYAAPVSGPSRPVDRAGVHRVIRLGFASGRPHAFTFGRDRVVAGRIKARFSHSWENRPRAVQASHRWIRWLPVQLDRENITDGRGRSGPRSGPSWRCSCRGCAYSTWRRSSRDRCRHRGSAASSPRRASSS